MKDLISSVLTNDEVRGVVSVQESAPDLAEVMTPWYDAASPA